MFPPEIKIYQGQGSSRAGCLIVAGQHGDEKSGIKIARSLISELNSYKILQTIKILPSVNIPGYSNNTRTFGGLDMNRLFESKNHPAYLCVSLIRDMAQKSKLVIDIHSTPKFVMKSDVPIIVSKEKKLADNFHGMSYYVTPPKGSFRSFCENNKIPFVLYEAIENDFKSEQSGTDDIMNLLSQEKYITKK